MYESNTASPSIPRVMRPASTGTQIRNSLVFAALTCFAAAAAAQTVPVGNATPFAVLGATAVTNTGSSVVTGELGISPNGASSVTGFPPGTITGATHFADAVALNAQNDTTTAYNTLAGRACGTTISGDLGGSTLTPGVYCSASTMGLTGALTLNAQGDPNAVFVFQVGSALTTASGASVVIINGGQACNVFWQIGSSATLGTGTSFAGNILALVSITANTGSSVSGRLLARTGAVTLSTTNVTVCSLAGGGTVPTLEKFFNPTTINPNGVSTLTITLGNPNASVATLSSALVDTLPSGVVVAALPNATTTCGGAVVPVAVAGASTVTLPSGATIPANGLCTVRVNVTAALVGTYVNTLPIGALVTSNGNNPAPATATLIVVAGATSVPLLSPWSILLLLGVLGGVGLIAIRMRAS